MMIIVWNFKVQAITLPSESGDSVDFRARTDRQHAVSQTDVESTDCAG